MTGVESAPEDLVIGLLSAGIYDVSRTSVDITITACKNTIQNQWEYEEIDHISNQFQKELRNNITEINKRSDTKELSDVDENWEKIIAELYGLGTVEQDAESEAPDQTPELIFMNSEDAAEQIAAAIARADGYDINNTPDLKKELEEAVLVAYRKTIQSFTEQVDSDEVLFQGTINILRAIEDLRDHLHELEIERVVPRLYDVYSGDEAGRKQAVQKILREGSALQVQDVSMLEIKSVNRPEIDHHKDTTRLLLLGMGGAGKTHALAELLLDYEPDISHIVIPDETLDSTENINQLYREEFEGNILLVWDDIHAINPENNNSIFRKTINRLEEVVADDSKLHILAAGGRDRGKFQKIPGNPYRQTSSLWNKFEVEELEPLDESQLERLFNRLIEASNKVEASERIRKQFSHKAEKTDPSPLYVTSVLETVTGGELTSTDITQLPESTIEIWQDQYREVKASNDEQWHLLRVIKLLAKSRIPLYRSLILGVYTEVFDRPRGAIDDRNFDRLTEQQWCVPVEDNSVPDERYVTHDIKIEAIEAEVTTKLERFSNFCIDSISDHLPESDIPIDVIANFHLGTTFDEQDELQKAKWELSRYAGRHFAWALLHHTDATPLRNSILNNYALFLESRGDIDEASRIYEKALEINLIDPVIHLNYANLLKEKGYTTDAARHYAQSLIINDDIAETHYSYGNLLSNRGDQTKAAQHFAKALRLNPDDAKSHINYSKLLLGRGDNRTAARHLAKALRLDPGSADAHNNYATLLANRNDVDKAISHYEGALEIDENHTDALNNYGWILQDREETRKAARYLARAVRLAPDEPRVHYNYGRVLMAREDLPKAAYHLAIAVRLVPHAAKYHISYGALLDMRGDHNEAAHHYARSLQIEYNDPEAHTRYASLLWTRGDWSKAARHFAKALQLNSDNQIAHIDYANLLDERGDSEQAARHYARALQIDPGNPLVHTNYADLLHSRGDRRKAWSHRITALKSDPEHELAQQYYRQTIEEIQRAVQRCITESREGEGIEYCLIGLEALDPRIALYVFESQEELYEVIKWFKKIWAQLETSANGTQNLYRWSLIAIKERNAEEAISFLKQVWNRRDRFNPSTKTYAICLGAGVGLAACLTTLELPRSDGAEEQIFQAIEPDLERLSTPSKSLYNVLTLEEEDLDSEDIQVMIRLDNDDIDLDDPTFLEIHSLSLIDLERLVYAGLLNEVVEIKFG